MAVKKKDRSVSKNDILNSCRTLLQQILILTRPKEINSKGQQIQKPGLLGQGQIYSAFGLDILTCGKRIHATCKQGLSIKLTDEESRLARAKYFDRSIEYCDSILQLTDFCIWQYGTSKKKRKSLAYLGRLAYDMKKDLQTRKNYDNLILIHGYAKEKKKQKRN